MENVTTVNEFLLLGLTSVQQLQPFFFVIFLIIYLINLGWKWSYISDCDFGTQTAFPHVFFPGKPFLSGYLLLFSDIAEVLINLLSAHRAISFLGCITQLYFFHFLGRTEAMLLAVMAFDCFAAICNPLRYPVIMNPKVCILLAAVAWITSIFNALVHSVMTARLNFCCSQELNHFFCDVKPLLELACSNTLLNQWLLSVVTGSVSMGAFFLTLLSYLYIICSLLLKHKSCRILHQALSTCGSHFTVVCLFYGPVGFTYIHPASATSMTQDRMVAIVYSAVTPVLNPLIYTLRNKEVRLALKKTFRSKLFKDCWQHHRD